VLYYTPMELDHIIESQQFDRESLKELFALANSLEKEPTQSLKGKIMAALFYEPSTRTRLSFESAMLRLGGSVIGTENAKEFSSAIKGETLEDTVRVIGSYADVIVLRHTEEGASEKAASVSSVPIINAGDGAGQHPTQSLLDLYTIRRELKRVDGLSIALSGDLKHSRTVRSLAYLLGKYDDVHIYFVSPRGLGVKDDIKEYLDRHAVTYEEVEDPQAILPKLDVLYQNRIQKERFSNVKEYEQIKGVYRTTNETVEQMQPHAIIMNPLPRLDEVAPEVDSSKKAVYFKQAYYGLLIRMALLTLLLPKS